VAFVLFVLSLFSAHCHWLFSANVNVSPPYRDSLNPENGGEPFLRNVGNHDNPEDTTWHHPQSHFWSEFRHVSMSRCGEALWLVCVTQSTVLPWKRIINSGNHVSCFLYVTLERFTSCIVFCIPRVQEFTLKVTNTKNVQMSSCNEQLNSPNCHFAAFEKVWINPLYTCIKQVPLLSLTVSAACSSGSIACTRNSASNSLNWHQASQFIERGSVRC
jgi:hypothetical protein